MRRSPHHRGAPRRSCAISRVAFGPEGRQEGDFHRRIESVRSRHVSRRVTGGMNDHPALSGRASADPAAVLHVELNQGSPAAHAPTSVLFVCSCRPRFPLSNLATRRPQGFRSSSCLFAKTDARPATSRLCPLLPTRRSPSKPNGFPPTGCPRLRHGAEALLTAHSIRIGDRTGIEVASLATSKLERTSDDQDPNPEAPDPSRT